MKLYVNNFKGFAPKVPSRNKPTNFADMATNVDLSTGDITCWDHLGTTMTSLPSGVPSGAKCFFKWRFKGTDYWWGSTTYDRVNMSAISIPDSTSGREQLYWLADGGNLMVCEGQDLIDKNLKTIAARSILAGIDKPKPIIQLEVTGTPITGSQPTAYTYVVCFARAWADGIADIGPASEPAHEKITTSMSVTRYPGQNVQVTNITGMNASGYNTNRAYIYRSVVSSSGLASFEYAGEASFAVETPPSTVVSFTDVFNAYGLPLTSLSNNALPQGAHSFISLNNGLYCAAKDSTVYVSNLNRPYAFPQEYSVTISDEIVALGSFGNTVVALTTNAPVLITISDPNNPIVRPMQDPLPCVSKWSVVSTSKGVMYASTTGVMLLSTDAPKNITQQLYDTAQWSDQDPSDHYYTFFGNTLYMFHKNMSGYETLSFDEFAYSTLYNQLSSSGLIYHNDLPYYMGAGWWDSDTQTYYVKPSTYNRLYQFKMFPQKLQTETCTWRSKIFVSAVGAWRPAVIKINQESTCTCQVYLDGVQIFNQNISGRTPVKLPAGYTGTELYFVLTIPSNYDTNVIHSVTIAPSLVECVEGGQEE